MYPDVPNTLSTIISTPYPTQGRNLGTRPHEPPGPQHSKALAEERHEGSGWWLAHCYNWLRKRASSTRPQSLRPGCPAPKAIHSVTKHATEMLVCGCQCSGSVGRPARLLCTVAPRTCAEHHTRGPGAWKKP